MPPRLPPIRPRFSWTPASFVVAAFVSLCTGALLTGMACQDPEPFRNQLLTDGGFDETGGTGPTGGNGGTGGATGGHATGGVATGGAGTGGKATGGVATGGAATGGAMTGGAATGGVATGGLATGGAMTGGSPMGGKGTGGVATGGVATGGAATGGAMGGAGGGGGSACFTQARALCVSCKENGNSLQKTCEDVLDCVVAHWPCSGNCMTTCLNASAGSGVVQTCVTNDLKMCQ